MKFHIKHRFNAELNLLIEGDSFILAFESAIKKNVSFKDANLVNADLVNANLSNANLVNAKLVNAKLSNANLVNANLVNADLVNANFSNADLVNANLVNVDLVNANFSNADLVNTKLVNAKGINKYLVTPLLMLHDQIGKIRAYKIVDSDNKGIYYPDIIYEMGKSITVEDANCDELQNCGRGINVATLDWCASEWKIGRKILIVEFEAKDIAVVPVGTDGKFRLKKCKVVGEKDLKEIGLMTNKP